MLNILFMMKNIILRTILIVGLAGICSSKFLEERLRIIDSNNSNYILRGNLPINDNKTFQANELKASIQKITGLQHYRFISISLLNFLTAKETKNRYIEEKFFQNNPQFGQLQSYVVLGSFISANDLPDWLREFIAPYYQLISFDKLHRLLNRLRKYLESQQPTVVFVHCSAGVDRTGMIGGSYQMKFFNKEFSTVHSQNIEILGDVGRKHMHFNAFNGMQWFCLNLGRTIEQCSVKVQDI